MTTPATAPEPVNIKDTALLALLAGQGPDALLAADMAQKLGRYDENKKRYRTDLLRRSLQSFAAQGLAELTHEGEGAQLTPKGQAIWRALNGETDTPGPGGAKGIIHDLIHPDPMNARKLFDEEELAGLADSIAAEGLLQNLIVRVDPDPERAAAGHVQLVGGERRWRAVALLIKSGRWPWNRPLPCLVKDYSGDDSETRAALDALAENMQRANLNPVEESDAFAALREAGVSTADIAARVGRTQRYVQQRLQLQNLSEEDRQALIDGSISIHEARALVQESGSTPDQTAEGGEGAPTPPRDGGVVPAEDGPADLLKTALARTADRLGNPDDDGLAAFVAQVFMEGARQGLTNNGAMPVGIFNAVLQAWGADAERIERINQAACVQELVRGFTYGSVRRWYAPTAKIGGIEHGKALQANLVRPDQSTPPDPLGLARAARTQIMDAAETLRRTGAPSDALEWEYAAAFKAMDSACSEVEAIIKALEAGLGIQREPIDANGDVVQGDVDYTFILPSSIQPNASLTVWNLAEIEIHRHDDGRWMWGVTHPGGGYRVGPKWGNFADSAEAALIAGTEELIERMNSRSFDGLITPAQVKQVIAWANDLRTDPSLDQATTARPEAAA